VACHQRSVLQCKDILLRGFQCIEKLTALNLRAIKSTLSEIQAILSMSLSVNDPQELLELQTRRAQAAMEEAQSNWRHVNNIVHGPGRTGRDR
jgi:phasin family protein